MSGSPVSWLSWLSCLILVAATSSAQQAPDRSKPPELGPPPSLDLPAIQKHTLSNGLPVWLVESHEVPLVQVNLLVLAGGAEDPAGRFGVASLAAAMLDEGAGTRSALEIADALELLGAVLNTSSSFDASAVRLNVPVAQLADALPIMADVALRPTFPAEDLERLRQERLTSLLQARDDPESIASMAFSRLVFGGPRYGTGTAGTASSVKGFTAADLRRFHAAFYQPSNAALIVVGDVQPASALPLLEKQFGGWKADGAAPRTPLAAAPQLRQGQLYLVDKPGAAQSEIRIGWVGAPRSTPDYFALEVLNTVLGGSFTSRLNQNLREEPGYAYGAGSAFDMRLAPGPFVAAAAVQTDKTAPALQEFFKELREIARPIGAGELAKAKNYLALSFPGEFETIGDVSRRLEELIVYRLPDDYFERYIARIQAVTSAEVQKASAAYLQPSKFAIVVVGDRKVIEAPVRGLKLAPVRAMSVEEALGQ